ncbi:MAG TPA: acyl-CoA dehydrogenase family protein [Candidatus Binataceae bacterium]|nr:acyl-CoA dehydrogenase family protein [Candidatus Binataceae bacterium]
MGNIQYEADLSGAERAAHETAHRFAAEVMRPAGIKLDALANPEDVIAKDSILWDVYRKYRAVGLAQLEEGSTGLTPAQQVRMRCIVGEQLGWGDSGLAISFGVAGFPRMMAQMSGKPELIRRFGAEDLIGCWAGTEPDHGSDMIYYMNRPGEELPGRPNCIARKDGDSFVINGQKSAWVSNGTIAKAAALFCAVDMADGRRGSGGFLVPLDVPGVSKGKPLNKIGQRALNQGEIFFDQVRIPADYMVIPPETCPLASEAILTMANTGMGTTFVGVAQAALDLALDYAKQRVQGGVPIFQHQSVRLRLFEMFRMVQAARALSRQVALYNALNPPKLQLATASKVTSTNTAFEVASSALQIFGGNGLSRAYPIEKLLRDARASMIEDGCNDLLSLVAAESL